MNEELNQIVKKLDDFDCKEHHWYEEVGEYDTKTNSFLNSPQYKKFDENDWFRINEERKLYRELIKLRTINFASAGYENKKQLFKKAFALERFGLTSKQICQKLQVNENFLRANREEYKIYKATEIND